MKLMNKSNNEIVGQAPRLDTVLMVEEFIEEHTGEYNQIELFKNLPKKMVWRTFKIILTYLENLNKIVVNKDGTITWIWNPKLIEKYLHNKKLDINL